MIDNKHYLRLTLVVVVSFLVALFPIRFRSFFERPVGDGLQSFFRIALPGALLLLVGVFWRLRLDVKPSEKTSLFVLLLGITALLVDLHLTFVDHSSNYFGAFSNEQFQIQMHNLVLRLDPQATGHNYRFLPDCILRYLEFLTNDYAYARSIFRHAFTFMLLYLLYRYARLYTAHAGAVLAVVLYAVIYPVTMRYYAGQCTDPMSHVSFLLAFICLERELIYPFALCVLVGIFAKESIALMPFYYCLQNWKQGKSLGRPLLVIGLALLVFGGIRYFVLHGQTISYDKISGVGPAHIMENLQRLNDWPRQFLFSAGIFLPFLFIGRRQTNAALRDLAIFLVITLFVASLVFSWLAEARNFVPAAFPLIVIAANCLAGGAAMPGSTVDARRGNKEVAAGQNGKPHAL